MYEVREGVKYSKEHEWAKVLNNNLVCIGITAFAQHELGDIVFVELPEVGAEIRVNQSIGTVESVKAVSDIYSPVSGKIIKVNEGLEDSPEAINQDAYGEGWIVEVEMTKPEELDQLLSKEQYLTFIKGE